MPEDLMELDTELEETPAEETIEEQPEGETTEQTEGEEQQPEVTSLFEDDGKRVAKPIRDTLAKIKTENASVGKLITDAVYRAAEFRREFPGGLTEVRGLRDDVEKLGGLESIRQNLDTANELRGLADAFMDGDSAAVVDDMIASSPESFSAMAPVVMDRFREVSPEGWSSYLGRVLYADAQANDIPLHIMRLADLVQENKTAFEIVSRLSQYFTSFKALAEKAPPAVKSRQKAAETEQPSREMELRAREWAMERQSMENELKTSIKTRALAGRKPDTEEGAQIDELFGSRAKKLADRLFPKRTEVATGYIKRGDKDGYMRYIKSVYQRVWPEAMASAVASTMKGKPGPKSGTQQTKTAPVSATRVGEGFALVSKEPAAIEINWNLTTKAMISKNQAVTTSGKKVQWR